MIRTPGPVMIVNAVYVEGEEGQCLRRAQGAAIRAVLEWFAAHPEEEQSTSDGPTVHTRRTNGRRAGDK